MKFPAFLRTFLRIVTGCVLLFLLIAVPSVLVLLQNQDFKNTIKHRIEVSLSGETVQVHIGKLSFHPLNRLTAEDVVLSSPQKGAPPLGTIDRLSISLNLFGFLPWHQLVRAIHLRNASVNAPLSEDMQYILPIRHANAKIILGREVVKIPHASFMIEGVHFRIRGQLLNPQMLKSLRTSAKPKKAHLERLMRLLQELTKVQYQKARPKADILFEANLSKPRNIQLLSIAFHAEDFRYQQIFVHRLELNATYVQGDVQIRQFRLEDPSGSLTVSGIADVTNSKGRLFLHSSINPTPFLREFAPHWEKVHKLQHLHMETAPKIDLSTDVSWKEGKIRCHGSGSVVLNSFFYKDISFPLLELKLFADNNIVKIEQLELQDTQGKLTATGTADLAAAKGNFALDSSLSPLPILEDFIPDSKSHYLKNLRTPSPPQIRLSADVSWENKQLHYQGTGSASLMAFSYHQQFFPELNVQFSAKDGLMNIEQIRIQDARGELLASGNVDLNASKCDFSLQSSVNFLPLIGPFIPQPQMQALWNLSSEKPPQLNLSAELSWKEKNFVYKSQGEATLQSFYYKKQFFPQLDLKFATQNEETNIQDLRLKTQLGIVKANVLIAPNKFQIWLDSTASPKEFSEFVDPAMRQFFNAMDIVDLPHLTLNFTGPKPDLASLSGEGELTLGRMAVRKAWIDFARTKFELTPQGLTFRDFVIGRGKGRGSGTVTYDFKDQHVYLKGVESTLVPENVLRWINLPIAKVISVYRFHAPPFVKLQGVVHLTDPNHNARAIYIDSQAGLNYDLLERTLQFGATTAEVHIDGPWVKVRIPYAGIFQGSAAVGVNVSIDPKNPIFDVDLTLSRVDFASLTKLYFNYDDSQGFLTGNFKFQAFLGRESDMVGSGNVRIEDGTVLSVPFLGPISLILNQLLPGAGNAPAKNATADFQVRNRKVMTDNLEISGAGFTLQGHGDIEFLTGNMDMTIRIIARGLPGLLFFPISRLFEYESWGTLMKPEWHLKSPFKPPPGRTR